MNVDKLTTSNDRSRKLQKASSSYYPQEQDQYLPSRSYPSAYDCGKAYQQDERDWERFAIVDVRMPSNPDTAERYWKHGMQGKGSWSDSGCKNTLYVNGYERKKTSRAAQHELGVPTEKSTSFMYNTVPSDTNGYKPTSYSSGSFEQNAVYSTDSSYYLTEPMYHDVPLTQYSEPQPLVYPGYGEPHFDYYPSPSAAPQTLDPYDQPYQSVDDVQQPYPYTPLLFYGSMPPAVYPDYGLPPTVYYPPPTFAPPAADPSKPPTSGAGSGPTGGDSPYKMATDEQHPSFAAPVRERLNESPKAPVISAYGQPSAPESTTNSNTMVKAETKAPGNGTTVHQATTVKSTATPMTTTKKPKMDDEAFWAVDENAESTTDLVEESAER